MVVFSLGILTACEPSGSQGTGGTPTPPPEQQATLTLNKSQTDLVIGQYEKLIATLTNVTGNVTWSTSNSRVATVSTTGMVTGVSAGTSKITARINDLSASCTVKVGLGNYLPTIQLEGVD